MFNIRSPILIYFSWSGFLSVFLQHGWDVFLLLGNILGFSNSCPFLHKLAAHYFKDYSSLMTGAGQADYDKNNVLRGAQLQRLPRQPFHCEVIINYVFL